jgi:hypothetical protein
MGVLLIQGQVKLGRDLEAIRNGGSLPRAGQTARQRCRPFYFSSSLFLSFAPFDCPFFIAPIVTLQEFRAGTITKTFVAFQATAQLSAYVFEVLSCAFRHGHGFEFRQTFQVCASGFILSGFPPCNRGLLCADHVGKLLLR